MNLSGNSRQMSKHRGKTFISSHYLNDEQKELFDKLMVTAVQKLEYVRNMASYKSWSPPFVSITPRGVEISIGHGVVAGSEFHKWSKLNLSKEDAIELVCMFTDLCFEYDIYRAKRFSIKVNDELWTRVKGIVAL